MASSGTTVARGPIGLREALFRPVASMAPARLPEMEMRRVFTGAPAPAAGRVTA